MKKNNDHDDHHDDDYDDDHDDYSTYYLIVNRKLWSAFKATATLLGLKLRDAIALALSEFVEKHGSTSTHIDVKIVQDCSEKENLLQLIVEEEVKQILNEIIRIKKLLSSDPRYQANRYEKEKMINLLEENKQKLIDALKKHPTVSSDLAREIKIALKNID